MYKNINIFLEDIETQTYVFPILFVNKYFKLVRNLNLNSRDKINNSIAIKFYHLKKFKQNQSVICFYLNQTKYK